MKKAGVSHKYGESGIGKDPRLSSSRLVAAYCASEHHYCSSELGREVDALFGNRVSECRQCFCSAVGARFCKSFPTGIGTGVFDSASVLPGVLDRRFRGDENNYSLER